MDIEDFPFLMFPGLFLFFTRYRYSKPTVMHCELERMPGEPEPTQTEIVGL